MVEHLRRLWAVALLAAVLGPAAGAASEDQGSFGEVIRIDRNAFKPSAGLITFSEKRRGSRNPLYRPGDYGGEPNGITVTFAGFFQGQRLANSAQCPRGANRSGCIAGLPSAPLTLMPNSPTTFIENDGSNPRSPSLSGSPRFNGAVSIMFSRDIAGVGLVGGYFNAVRSTAIRVFDRNGNQIGGVKNLATGMEYLALVTSDGSERIAGLQFSLVGPEPAGYAIDDLSFAFASQINREQVPGLSSVFDAEVARPADPPAQAPVGSLADLFAAPTPAAEAAPEAAEDAAPAKPAAEPKPSLKSLFDN